MWQVEGVWWRVETPTGLFGWAHSGSLKPVKELVREVPGDTQAGRHWGHGQCDTGSEEDSMTLPVVLDLNGVIRDWAWLRAKYGNVTYLEAAQYPKFQLIKVEEMEGPQTLIVNTGS